MSLRGIGGNSFEEYVSCPQCCPPSCPKMTKGQRETTWDKEKAANLVGLRLLRRGLMSLDVNVVELGRLHAAVYGGSESKSARTSPVILA